MPITELRIEGLRTLEKIRLSLDGLTVLIGDNGAGKSSILEACEILRRATGRRFMDEFYGIHGGLTALLRQGAPRLMIGVTIQLSPTDFARREGAQHLALEPYPDWVEYDLALAPSSTFFAIEEVIRVGLKKSVRGRSAEEPRKSIRKDLLIQETVLARTATEYRNPEEPGAGTSIARDLSFLASLPETGPSTASPFFEGQIVAAHLRNLRVHIPFETMPAWAARALDRKSALRTPALLTPATHLEKPGVNLASAYHALKNSFGRSHWEDTLAYIRLGLGERIEDVVTWADPSGGSIGLSIKRAGLDGPIAAAQLSDGMLSYLAFVAMFRLHVTRPSLMAFDEPDLHLHPHLLMRVLDFFESMAKDTPVLVATHSDRLLDGLTDPAKSVVLCSLDERGATRLVRPDREALARWLERYRGLGDIRSAGHAASVMTKVEPR